MISNYSQRITSVPVKLAMEGLRSSVHLSVKVMSGDSRRVGGCAEGFGGDDVGSGEYTGGQGGWRIEQRE